MGWRLGRRARRGQATVETVLGVLVFVTVLIFAVHFAEIAFLSIKVTEAAHSALLDATGHQLHEWPDDASPSRRAARQAGADATARYQDFDSRTSTNGAGVITLAFTRASGLAVDCRPGGPSHEPHLFTALAYSDGGGIRCQAQADLTAIRIPQRFVEDTAGTAGSGFFQEEHYALRPIRVCGIGRAWRNGECSAGLVSMLDDWGLTGPDESGSCPIIPDVPLPCPGNVPYWSMAASVYGISLMANAGGPDTSASRLAQNIVGGLPFPFFYGAENVFWMSAMGEEFFFGQPLPSDTLGGASILGLRGWPTSPGLLPPGLTWQSVPYPLAYANRDECFLGRACPP